MNKMTIIFKAKPEQHIATLLLALVLLFCLTSCSKTTSSTKSTLSGTVILTNDTGNAALDPADYSGVTVALYDLATLDAAMVDINNQYSNIGIEINQQTEFDHRLQAAVLNVTTDSDGEFLFSQVIPGIYNLVVFKQGWGVKYLYGIQVVEGDNNLATAVKTSEGLSKANSNRSVIELFPVVELSGYVSTAYEFLSNHNYLVIENLTFTGNVIFNPEVQIWINPSKSISFYAVVTTPEESQDFVRISTSDAIYSTAQHAVNDIQKFYNLDCNSSATFSQNKISRIITTFSELGWRLSTSGITVSEMILRHVKTGISMQQVNSVEILRCNLQNSVDPELGGINFNGCTNTTISHLIVMNCTTGIRQLSSDSTNVYNSYFYGNSVADIDNLYETVGNVNNCTFENSAKGVATSGSSYTTIQYCNFLNTIGIHNFHQLNWNRSWFTAHYNNFYCSEYNAMSTAVFTVTELIHMDALNNYWGTTDTEIIEAKIYDYDDLPGPDPNHPEWTIWAAIDYAPYRTSVVPNAGVQPD